MTVTQQAAGGSPGDTAPQTIDDVFRRASKARRDAPHLVLGEGVASYADTFTRASRLAGHLIGAGVEPGERVGSLIGNCRELYELYIACSLAGAIAVPINVLSSAREVAALHADCQLSTLLVDHPLLGRTSGAASSPYLKTRLVVRGHADGWTPYEEALLQAAPVSESRARPDAAAMIIYSSGTTGQPKGITLAHRALVRNAILTSGTLGYRAGDTFLSLLPSFSSFGYSFDFLQLGLAGARLVVLGAFDAHDALDFVERHRVTCLAGVPTMFVRMFEPALAAGRDLSSLRLIDVGGGPVPDALKRRLQQELDLTIVESYGLTEISPVASVERPSNPSPPGSCGPPLADFEVRAVDGDGRDVPAGESGELLFRADTFMLGYWNQPAVTAQALRDGWLHTGDIGKIDEDGNIYVVDRLKDMIVTSGYNVYPKDVENVIFDHPEVLTVAVVGIPDETRGENIHAFVVRRPGSDLTEAELLEHCRVGLARYKVPRRVSFVDELPLTASGKIRRFMLASQAATGEAATA